MPEPVEIKFFKLSEVAVNDGCDGKLCWIIIRDSVYDVTNYLDDHPGGGELISEWAGKDATKGFDDFGHSGDAKKILKQFKIGEIIEDERRSKNNSGKGNQKNYSEISKKKKHFKFFFCM